jgi:hypothetical protein
MLTLCMNNVINPAVTMRIVKKSRQWVAGTGPRVSESDHSCPPAVQNMSALDFISTPPHVFALNAPTLSHTV